MTVQRTDNTGTHRRLGSLALTSVNAPTSPGASFRYTSFMQIPARDREIVQLVGRFKHLSTSQIKRLVYPDQAHEPQRRAIDRLLRDKLLARVNQRMPGGNQAGSQMYIYQLGSQGRKLYQFGRRGHSIAVDHHALAVADVYVALFEANRRGEIKLLNWAAEPDCHIDLGGIHLEPDLYVDIVTVTKDGQAIRHPRFIELDMGTEHKAQILEKIGYYKTAYESKDQYPLPIYPTVLWLATRDERASELQYWMRYARPDPEYVQAVSTVDKLLLSILT